MKIFSIIFMIIGAIAIAFTIPDWLKVIEAKQAVGGGDFMGMLGRKIETLTFISQFGGVVILLGGIFYFLAVLEKRVAARKENRLNKLSESIQRIRPRKRNTEENYSLSIECLKYKRWGSATIQIQIDGVDKGIIKDGEVSSFELEEGAHQLTLNFKSVPRTKCSHILMLDVSKDTVTVLRFELEGASGEFVLPSAIVG